MDQRQIISRTPYKDQLLRFLQKIAVEMQESPLLVGPGLPQLIESLADDMHSGATGSALIGKIRELFYGYARFQEGIRVQFGVMGANPQSPVTTGAGGDITLFLEGDQRITIQSKYISSTATSLNPFYQNLREAARQLSGDGGEMPYLHSVRQADIVIEDIGFAGQMFLLHEIPLAAFEMPGVTVVDVLDAHEETEALVRLKQHLCSLVTEALDDDDRVYPALHLWKHVDSIQITGKVKKNLALTCLIEVKQAQSKQLLVQYIKSIEILPMDFPYDCSYTIEGEMVSLAKIILGYTAELPLLKQLLSSQQSSLEKTRTSSVVSQKMTGAVTLSDPQKALILSLTSKGQAKVDPRNCPIEDLVDLLVAVTWQDPSADPPPLDLFIRILRGEYKHPKRNFQEEAYQALAGIFGQISVTLNKETPPTRIDIGTRASKLLGAVVRELKDEKSSTSSTPVSLSELLEMYPLTPQALEMALSPDVFARLTQLAEDAEQSIVFILCDRLRRALELKMGLQFQAALPLIESILTFPFGLEICELLAFDRLEQACAYNYKTVLGQLVKKELRWSSLWPLKLAYDLWKREQQDPQHPGCVLAFEYDEKTPGMWQITREHFDMDVGWVLETSPLEVQSIYQVKVVEKADPGILFEAKSSLSGGQLSLVGPQEKELVIYCPNQGSGDLPASWIKQAIYDLSAYGRESVALTVCFADSKIFSINIAHLRMWGKARQAQDRAASKAKEAFGKVAKAEEYFACITTLITDLDALTSAQPLPGQIYGCFCKLQSLTQSLSKEPPAIDGLLAELVAAREILENSLLLNEALETLLRAARRAKKAQNRDCLGSIRALLKFINAIVYTEKLDVPESLAKKQVTGDCLLQLQSLALSLGGQEALLQDLVEVESLLKRLV